MVLSTSTGKCSPPSPEPGRETLCWSLSKFPFFPVVAVWMWHLFHLAEFLSYLSRENSYWNLIIQALTWIFRLSCCRNFYRRRQQTHRISLCDFILDVTPWSLAGTLLGGGGKAVSKKPLDPIAKMPEPFRPVPALIFPHGSLRAERLLSFLPLESCCGCSHLS